MLVYIGRRVFHTQFHTPTSRRWFLGNPNKTRRVLTFFFINGVYCMLPWQELQTKGGIKRLISEEILVEEWAETLLL